MKTVKLIFLFLIGISLGMTIVFGTLKMIALTFWSAGALTFLTAFHMAILGNIEEDTSLFGRILMFLLIMAGGVVCLIFIPNVFGWK